MNTREYLDAIKLRLRIESDYALAKKLDIGQSTVSRWRTGEKTIGDDLAPRVAEILSIRPERVLADLQAERASNEALRDIWRKVAATFACAATLGIAGLTTPAPASASNLTSYQFSTQRRRQPTKNDSCAAA
jgi:transcriptional regulator with XRE-family HTH domain